MSSKYKYSTTKPTKKGWYWIKTDITEFIPKGETIIWVYGLTGQDLWFNISKKEYSINLLSKTTEWAKAMPPDELKSSGDTLDHITNSMASKSIRFETALVEISKGRGRYDEDKLKHASNTIEDMKKIALEALAEQNQTSGGSEI